MDVQAATASFGQVLSSMRVPVDRTEEEIAESAIIQKIFDTEFEGVDQSFSAPRKPIDGVEEHVILEDEIVHLLIMVYRPFLSVLLAQIVRKAASRVSESNTHSIFSIDAMKGVVFLAQLKPLGDVRYLKITIDRRVPASTKGR